MQMRFGRERLMTRKRRAGRVTDDLESVLSRLAPVGVGEGGCEHW